MFHRQFGAINGLLGARRHRARSPGSRASGRRSAANVATNVWLGFPFMMVVTLGALSRIPKELEEAAALDGADALAAAAPRRSCRCSGRRCCRRSCSARSGPSTCSTSSSSSRAASPTAPPTSSSRRPTAGRSRAATATATPPPTRCSSSPSSPRRRCCRAAATEERRMKALRTVRRARRARRRRRGHALPGPVGAQDGALAVAGLLAVAVARCRRR